MDVAGLGTRQTVAQASNHGVALKQTEFGGKDVRVHLPSLPKDLQ